MGVKRRERLSVAIITAITLVMLFIALFPLFYMMIQSFAPGTEVNRRLIPSTLTLANYAYLLDSAGSNPLKWVRSLLNSFIVCVPTGLASVFIGVTMGYALTKLKNFRGKKLIIDSLLFQMFFPTIMLLVPKYMILRGLANSYPGMILPFSVSVWAIFMYNNFYRTLPDEVFEAAKVDGAGHWRSIWNIALPSTQAVTVIVFLTVFMNRWNELMWDMVISPNVNFQTLNVLITTNINVMRDLQGPLYAASCVLIMPIILLFLCCSRYFKEGINFMLK